MKKIMIVCMLILMGQSSFAGNTPYYNQGIKKLLNHYYGEMLYRMPDFSTNGHFRFLKAVPCNERTHAKIVLILSMQDEFKERVYAESGYAEGEHEYWVLMTRKLYRAFYHREPKQAGLDAWVARFENEENYVHVVSSFLNSPEAVDVAKWVCRNQYITTY